MAKLTWIHLSDWHHQLNKFHQRSLVLKELMNDIKYRTAISENLEKIDFIVFSGDVAFQAKPEEYDDAYKEFFQPLYTNAGVGTDRIFIVPGNHDFDREILKELPNFQTIPQSPEETNAWLEND